MPNPYYDPEKLGLVLVGELEFKEPNYDFDMGIVWYHPETDKFFYAEDSGCSCPSPFEDYGSLEDFDEPMNFLALKKRLRNINRASEYDPPSTPIQMQVHGVLGRALKIQEGYSGRPTLLDVGLAA